MSPDRTALRHPRSTWCVWWCSPPHPLLVLPGARTPGGVTSSGRRFTACTSVCRPSSRSTCCAPSSESPRSVSVQAPWVCDSPALSPKSWATCVMQCALTHVRRAPRFFGQRRADEDLRGAAGGVGRPLRCAGHLHVPLPVREQWARAAVSGRGVAGHRVPVRGHGAAAGPVSPVTSR